MLASSPRCVCTMVPTEACAGKFAIGLISARSGMYVGGARGDFRTMESSVGAVTPFRFIPVRIPIAVSGVAAAPASMRFATGKVPRRLIVTDVVSGSC